MRRIVRIAEPRRTAWWRAAAGGLVLGSLAVAGGTQPGAAKPVPSASAVVAEGMAQLSAQALRDATAEHEENTGGDTVSFELCGIGRRLGVPVALVAVNGDLSAVIEGSDLVQHRVVRIDVERKALVLQEEDRPVQTLTLAQANLLPASERTPDIEDRIRKVMLSKNSVQNLGSFRGPPHELTLVWSKVNREGQIETLSRYLDQGLAVGIIKHGNVISGYSRRILDGEIRSLLSEKRNAFLQSLSADQQAAFGNGLQQAIRFTDPAPEREKQLAAAKEAEARREQILADLTPEQKALYDEWQSWLPTPGRMQGASRPIIRPSPTR